MYFYTNNFIITINFRAGVKTCFQNTPDFLRTVTVDSEICLTVGFKVSLFTLLFVPLNTTYYTLFNYNT